MSDILKKRDALFDCDDDNEHVIAFLDYQIWKARHMGLYK